MFNWSPEDENERWIYRTIYPSEIRSSRETLITFKHMEEDNAEANWNYDEHITDQQNIPLVMTQRKNSKDLHHSGISFSLFAKDHPSTEIIQDLPSTAEMGNNFSIIVDGNKSIQDSKAYKQIIIDNISRPKKIANSSNGEISLKAFLCYKADSYHLLESRQFVLINDNDIRTVAPADNIEIGCVNCAIYGGLGAIPNGAQPPLYDLLDFKIHCIRVMAAAKPKDFCSTYDFDVHRLACIFYRGFECDISEEVSKKILYFLSLLDTNNYNLDALKLLNKEHVIDLLLILFMNEDLDEEESKTVGMVLLWVRNNTL